MNTKTEQKPRIWTGDFMKIVIVNFFIFVNFHALLPTFPFFVESLGGDAVTVGVATALFSLASIVARPFAGWLTDTRGRCVTLIAGLAGLSLMPLGYFFSLGLAVPVFFRALHGAFHATASNSSATWAADLLPKSKLGEGLGFYGLSMALSTAVAPAFGLWLMNGFGFRALFLAAAAVGIAGIVIGLSVHNRPKTAKAPLSISSLFEKAAVPAAVSQFLYMTAYGVVEVFVAVYAVSRGLGEAGSYFISMAIATVLARIILRKAMDARHEGWLVHGGNALLVLSIILLVLPAGEHLTFLVSGFAAGFSFGAVQPCLQTTAVMLSPEKKRGAANSTFFIAFDFGIAAGGFIAGALVKALGYEQMFLTMTVPVVLSSAAFALSVRRQLHSRRRKQSTPN